jgi:hypothetical protein
MLPLAPPYSDTQLIQAIWARAYVHALGTHAVDEAIVIADTALACFKTRMTTLAESVFSPSPAPATASIVIAKPPKYPGTGSLRPEPVLVRVRENDERRPASMDEHLEREWGAVEYLRCLEVDERFA